MCSNGADSNPEFEWLFADYNQLTDTYKIHKQMYTVHGEEGKTKGCHGVKKSPETSLHGHFSSKKKKAWEIRSQHWTMMTRIRWRPQNTGDVITSSGSLWSQERRSEGLSLYSDYGKEIQCLCSCRHTVCRDLRASSENDRRWLMTALSK